MAIGTIAAAGIGIQSLAGMTDYSREAVPPLKCHLSGRTTRQQADRPALATSQASGTPPHDEISFCDHE